MPKHPNKPNELNEREAGFQFPCDYAVKAMGLNSPRFQTRIVRLVEQHTGPIQPIQISTKPSRSKRYLSITLMIQAQSREQLDAIYQDLTDDDHVLMRL